MPLSPPGRRRGSPGLSDREPSPPANGPVTQLDQPPGEDFLKVVLEDDALLLVASRLPEEKVSPCEICLLLLESILTNLCLYFSSAIKIHELESGMFEKYQFTFRWKTYTRTKHVSEISTCAGDRQLLDHVNIFIRY